MPIGRGVLVGKPAIAGGQRDKRVLIQQTPAVTPGGGFPRDVWTSLITEWMSKKDMLADERFATGQEAAFAYTQWQMAYRADMDPELIDVPKTRRLNYQGRTYNIRAATLIGRKDGIELVTLVSSKVP